MPPTRRASSGPWRCAARRRSASPRPTPSPRGAARTRDLPAPAPRRRASRRGPPHGVNLAWAVERVMAAVEAAPAAARGEAEREARALHAEDAAACLRDRRARGGALPGRAVTLLTHCNTGALATGGIGTALGIVRTLHAEGRLAAGLRLRGAAGAAGRPADGVGVRSDAMPVTLLPDHAAAGAARRRGCRRRGAGGRPHRRRRRGRQQAGHLRPGRAGGRHGVPFVSAAPVSTFDLACPDGRLDPDRAARTAEEVAGSAGAGASTARVPVYNPPSTSRRPSWSPPSSASAAWRGRSTRPRCGAGRH